MHRACTETERVIRTRVGGQPEIAKKIFAVGGEVRKQIFLIFFDDVRDGFPMGFHDLKIVIVDPYAALKVALILFDGFRLDIEDVSGKIVDFLAAHIGDVVFVQIIAGEGEGLNFFEIVDVLLGQSDALKGIARRESDTFNAPTFFVEKDVALDLILAIGHIVRIERLQDEMLGPSVRVENVLQLDFALGEFLDDLVHGYRGRLASDGRFGGFSRSRFRSSCTRRAGSRTVWRRGIQRAGRLRRESCREKERGERKLQTQKL